MANLSDRKVIDLILPGTHDSSAYKLKSMWSFLVSNWTITQNKSIYNQLVSGIRYLDFRVSSSNGIFYLSHTFLTIELEAALDQITEFLNENKSEIVILKLVRDYADKNISVSQMYSFFESKVGNLLCKDFDTETTLSDLRASNCRIVHISDCYLFNEIWLNKTNPNDFYTVYKTPTSGLYNILDFVLTPDANYIFKNLICGSLLRMSQDLDLDRINLAGINVVAMDFPRDEVITSIIKRNV